MDLVGSIADTTIPLSLEMAGSVGDGMGSSVIDGLIYGAFELPNTLLLILGYMGGDLGSMGGTTGS